MDQTLDRNNTRQDPQTPRSDAGVLNVRSVRNRRVLAHLSLFANLLTGFAGTLVAFLLWWTHRRRSPGVARHAMRAFWHQVAWGPLIAPVGFLLTISLMLFLPVPEAYVSTLMLVAALAWIAAPFAEAGWAAYRASQDHEYRYLVDRLTGGGKSRRRSKNKAHSDPFDLDDVDDFDAWEDSSGGGGDSGSW